MTKPLNWYNVQGWGVEGKGWEETERPYDRLPPHARLTVPPEVWDLSRHSTGLSVRFQTNSSSIFARWVLCSSEFAMPHMPATSSSGVDLYAKDDSDTWRWVGTGYPESSRYVEVCVNYGLSPNMRAYMLYFPLFNGVESIEIGVDSGSLFTPTLPRRQKPIVFYGTSIVHGIAASRAGMSYTSILGRWLDTPIVNLGFSGRGKMEQEMAQLLAELDASIYVIDCLPNMEASLVKQRADNFLRLLVEAKPKVPIVLLEDRSYANSWIVSMLKQRNESSRTVLHDIFLNLGAQNISYVSGEALLGSDSEATVDGSHPNDLGFWRMARTLRPLLSQLLA